MAMICFRRGFRVSDICANAASVIVFSSMASVGSLCEKCISLARGSHVACKRCMQAARVDTLEDANMATELKIRVNEKSWSVDAAPDTPLLYVLLNDLSLKGPRFGCGLAQCGS